MVEETELHVLRQCKNHRGIEKGEATENQGATERNGAVQGFVAETLKKPSHQEGRRHGYQATPRRLGNQQYERKADKPRQREEQATLTGVCLHLHYGNNIYHNWCKGTQKSQ